MKIRKAMMTLAMSGLMVMAVPAALQAKTISVEQEDGSVKYYRYEVVGDGSDQTDGESEEDVLSLYIRNSEEVQGTVKVETGSEEAATTESEDATVVKDDDSDVMSIGTGTGVYTEDDKKLKEEYARVGIEQNEHGAWTLDGKTIYYLLDDNGSVIFNNSEEDNRLCVYVERDEKGVIKEASIADGKTIIQKIAEQ